MRSGCDHPPVILVDSYGGEEGNFLPVFIL
jgi:hypothetical protein